jgi:hypothetical protein
MFLEKHGFKAEPLPVTARVYNKHLWDRLMTGTFNGVMTDDDWGVGVGVPDTENLPHLMHRDTRPNRFNGHLVIWSEGFIIDTSLDQAARPQHKINCVPVFFEPPNGLINEVAMHNNDSFVIYHTLENDRYKVAPDWVAREPLCRRIVDEFETLMSDEVRKILSR